MNAMAPTEMMSLAQFQEDLRRVARYDTKAAAPDPIKEALAIITANPAMPGARLMLRLLHALADGAGEFRRADAAAFDTAGLHVVIGLLDAARAGSKSREEWLAAVAAADAAAAA